MYPETKKYKLLSKNQILNRKKTIKQFLNSSFEKNCIYFLVNNSGKIVYVGQSKIVKKRILMHKKNKSFSHVSITRCEKKAANILETLYICKFFPRYNFFHKSGKSKNLHAPCMGIFSWECYKIFSKLGKVTYKSRG